MDKNSCSCLEFLGLTKQDGWASVEDEIMVRFFPSEGANVASRLPRRTVSCCLKRAKELGLIENVKVRWSDAELGVLKEYYPSEGLDVALRLTGRSYDAIRRMVCNLGLTRV